MSNPANDRNEAAERLQDQLECVCRHAAVDHDEDGCLLKGCACPLYERLWCSLPYPNHIFAECDGRHHPAAMDRGGTEPAERASEGLDVERLALVFRENGYWDAYAVMVDHGKIIESEYARLTPASDRNEAAERLRDRLPPWKGLHEEFDAALANERAIGGLDVQAVAYEMKVFLHGAKMAPPVAPGWLAQIEKWYTRLATPQPGYQAEDMGTSWSREEK